MTVRLRIAGRDVAIRRPYPGEAARIRAFVLSIQSTFRPRPEDAAPAVLATWEAQTATLLGHVRGYVVGALLVEPAPPARRDGYGELDRGQEIADWIEAAGWTWPQFGALHEACTWVLATCASVSDPAEVRASELIQWWDDERGTADRIRLVACLEAFAGQPDAPAAMTDGRWHALDSDTRAVWLAVASARIGGRRG